MTLIQEWNRYAGIAMRRLLSDSEADTLVALSDEILTSEPKTLAHVFAIALLNFDEQAAAYGSEGNRDAERGMRQRVRALCDLARQHGVDGEIPDALAFFGDADMDFDAAIAA